MSCDSVVDTMSNYPHRVLKCSWSDSFDEKTLARIKVSGKDRPQLLLSIMSVISIDNEGDITSLKAYTQQGFFDDVIEIMVNSREKLEKIMKEVSLIEDVTKVERLNKVLD